MRKIKKLSNLLANQIAAGEVIDRPSAVVKELVENSIDAGADLIEIAIENSGVGLIRIRDNGCGISYDDLNLAVEPHATSKIYTQQELLEVNTLGFRGEALASISSVSRFKIISKIADSETAFIFENNQIKPGSHQTGTTIEVSDLFFNIKARRYFLKSTRTETLHIEDIVKRLILSNFNIAFKFIVDNKIIINLPIANSEDKKIQRINKILGKNFVENSKYISCHNESLEIYGWLGNIDYHRAQNNEQFIFLNSRAVKDKTLLHAVRSCYANLIPEGRSAAFILYLNVNPQEVDVNVHPTKSEVRFRKMRLVYDFIQQNIRSCFIVERVLDSRLRGNDERVLDPRLRGNDERVSLIIKVFFNRYVLFEKNKEYFIADLKKIYLDSVEDQLSWERISATITQGEIANMLAKLDKKDYNSQSYYKKVTEKLLEQI